MNPDQDREDMVNLGLSSFEVVNCITEQLQQKIDDKIVDEDLKAKIKPQASYKSI